MRITSAAQGLLSLQTLSPQGAKDTNRIGVNWGQAASLDLVALRHLLIEAIERLDVNQAKTKVAPFVPDHRALEVWSRDFFRAVTGLIMPVIHIEPGHTRQTAVSQSSRRRELAKDNAGKRP